MLHFIFDSVNKASVDVNVKTSFAQKTDCVSNQRLKAAVRYQSENVH